MTKAAEESMQEAVNEVKQLPDYSSNGEVCKNIGRSVHCIIF